MLVNHHVRSIFRLFRIQRNQFPIDSDPSDLLDYILALVHEVISSDNLIYLPNLYYRKYKLIEKLNNLRIDFPQQKILLSRKTTLWDQVVSQAKQKQFIMAEQKKYKIAEKYHLAKLLKQKVIKNDLRKEEAYLFQRIICSNLAQAVTKCFHEASLTQQTNQKNKKVQTVPPKHGNLENDGIFLQNNGYPERTEQDCLFDQLLNPNVQIDREGENNMDIEDKRCRIQKYFQKYIKVDKEILNQDLKKINKKSCFKKINEDLRKRFKNKMPEPPNQPKSFGSATIILNNLINSQPDLKPQQAIQLPSTLQPSLFNQQQRIKRKKEDCFDLRWNQAQLEELKNSNPSFDIKKNKLQSSVLALHMVKSQEEYHKIFDKNIKGKKGFPSHLKNVHELTLKEEEKYYNQWFDKDYQTFVMNNSKQRLMDDFIKASQYIFSETYSSDQPKSIEAQSIGKLFVSPNNYNSNRVIYKIHKNQLCAVIKPLDERSGVSKDHILLLSYLVRRYLSLFGNNWKLICECVRMNPCFSHLMLTNEQVQQLFQHIELSSQSGNKNFGKIQLWQKKILPFSMYTSGTYEKFAFQKVHKFVREDLQMTNEDHQEEDNQTKQLNLSNYQNLLNEPLKTQEYNTPFKKMNQQYDDYLHIVNTDDISQIPSYQLNHQKILSKFKFKHEETKSSLTNSQFGQYAHQILQKYKSQQKSATNHHKNKKIVNQKTSELVRVLQSLRKQPPTGNMAMISSSRLPPTPKIDNIAEVQKKKAPQTEKISIGKVATAQKPKPAVQDKKKKLKKPENKDDQTK